MSNFNQFQNAPGSTKEALALFGPSGSFGGDQTMRFNYGHFKAIVDMFEKNYLSNSGNKKYDQRVGLQSCIKDILQKKIFDEKFVGAKGPGVNFQNVMTQVMVFLAKVTYGLKLKKNQEKTLNQCRIFLTDTMTPTGQQATPEFVMQFTEHEQIVAQEGNMFTQTGGGGSTTYNFSIRLGSVTLGMHVGQMDVLFTSSPQELERRIALELTKMETGFELKLIMDHLAYCAGQLGLTEHILNQRQFLENDNEELGQLTTCLQLESLMCACVNRNPRHFATLLAAALKSLQKTPQNVVLVVGQTLLDALGDHFEFVNIQHQGDLVPRISNYDISKTSGTGEALFCDLSDSHLGSERRIEVQEEFGVTGHPFKVNSYKEDEKFLGIRLGSEILPLLVVDKESMNASGTSLETSLTETGVKRLFFTVGSPPDLSRYAHRGFFSPENKTEVTPLDIHVRNAGSSFILLMNEGQREQKVTINQLHKRLSQDMFVGSLFKDRMLTFDQNFLQKFNEAQNSDLVKLETMKEKLGDPQAAYEFSPRHMLIREYGSVPYDDDEDTLVASLPSGHSVHAIPRTLLGNNSSLNLLKTEQVTSVSGLLQSLPKTKAWANYLEYLTKCMDADSLTFRSMAEDIDRRKAVTVEELQTILGSNGGICYPMISLSTQTLVLNKLEEVIAKINLIAQEEQLVLTSSTNYTTTAIERAMPLYQIGTLSALFQLQETLEGGIDFMKKAIKTLQLEKNTILRQITPLMLPNWTLEMCYEMFVYPCLSDDYAYLRAQEDLAQPGSFVPIPRRDIVEPLNMNHAPLFYPKKPSFALPVKDLNNTNVHTTTGESDDGTGFRLFGFGKFFKDEVKVPNRTRHSVCREVFLQRYSEAIKIFGFGTHELFLYLIHMHVANSFETKDFLDTTHPSGMSYMCVRTVTFTGHNAVVMPQNGANLIFGNMYSAWTENGPLKSYYVKVLEYKVVPKNLDSVGCVLKHPYVTDIYGYGLELDPRKPNGVILLDIPYGYMPESHSGCGEMRNFLPITGRYDSESLRLEDPEEITGLYSLMPFFNPVGSDAIAEIKRQLGELAHLDLKDHHLQTFMEACSMGHPTHYTFPDNLGKFFKGKVEKKQILSGIIDGCKTRSALSSFLPIVFADSYGIGTGGEQVMKLKTPQVNGVDRILCPRVIGETMYPHMILGENTAIAAKLNRVTGINMTMKMDII